MITEKICPKCKAEFDVNRLMELVSVVEWGKSEKFDKQFKCYFRDGAYYCGLLLVQKAATE